MLLSGPCSTSTFSGSVPDYLSFSVSLSLSLSLSTTTTTTCPQQHFQCSKRLINPARWACWVAAQQAHLPSPGLGQAKHLGSRDADHCVHKSALFLAGQGVPAEGYPHGPTLPEHSAKRHAPECSTESGCSRSCSEFLGGGWGGKKFRTQGM